MATVYALKTKGLLGDKTDFTIETKAGVLPIKLEETSQTLEAMKNMQPKNQLFPTILQEMPRASIHPFCLETYDKHAHMHGRHFSSPFSGMTEDPVTGTASGVMGAYYAKYIKRDFAEPVYVDEFEMCIG